MNFFGFLRSLDDLLFEIMSWIIFYPVTLWRCLVHPLRMMAYAKDELSKDQAPFGEALSPPIFLLVTVVLAHGVELALIGQSALVSKKTGVAALVTDDMTLVILRLLVFATIPTIMAVQSLWWSRAALDRAALQVPFYAQCYAVTPAVLVTSILTTLGASPHAPDNGVQAAAYIATLTWFLVSQTLWFRQDQSVGTGKGVLIAVVGFVLGLMVFVALAWLIVGGVR